MQTNETMPKKVTLEMIEGEIAVEHYFTAADGVERARAAEGFKADPLGSLCRLTFCVLLMKNGFSVTGESACVDPAEFNAELGRKIARQNAINKVWALMGYELSSKREAVPSLLLCNSTL